MTTERSWHQATVIRLTDDGTFKVVQQGRFPGRDQALDWARATLATWLETSDGSFAVNVVSLFERVDE